MKYKQVAGGACFVAGREIPARNHAAVAQLLSRLGAEYVDQTPSLKVMSNNCKTTCRTYSGASKS
jgi:hypothetical protein